jgi:hypothetical protein
VVDDGLGAGVVYGEPAGNVRSFVGRNCGCFAIFAGEESQWGVQRQADRPIQNVSLRARGVGCEEDILDDHRRDANEGHSRALSDQGDVMNKDSFSVLIGDAYDGLEKTGEPVTMKAGHAAHAWVHRSINGLRAREEPDVRYRNSMVELDESLPPGVMVLSAAGERCTLVLTI